MRTGVSRWCAAVREKFLEITDRFAAFLPGAALWERGAREAARDGRIFEEQGIQGWMP